MDTYPLERELFELSDSILDEMRVAFRTQVGVQRYYNTNFHFFTQNEIIYFHSFRRLSNAEPGSGAAALEKLCSVADEEGATIALHAANRFLATRYYPRFGFRTLKLCKEWIPMIREPIGGESWN